MLFEPLERIERLAVLVPPPRFQLVRYSGQLAPRASWRDEVVPAPALCVGTGRGRANTGSVLTAGTQSAAEGTSRDTSPEAPHGRRLPWAHLLARVFLVDALCCERCGARMQILADIQTPEAIRSILECLSLPTRPPTLTAAVPSPFT